MMSSHSLIGLVQSFFTKSDVEAEDPMMAMSFGIASLPSVLHFVACWSLVRQTRQALLSLHVLALLSLWSFLGGFPMGCSYYMYIVFLFFCFVTSTTSTVLHTNRTTFWPDSVRMGSMGGAPMMPGGGPDPAKVYKTEQDSPFFLLSGRPNPP